MTGKQARQIKSRWQFAVGATLAAVLCSVSVWVVFKRFTVTPTVPSTLDPLSPPLSELPKTAGGNPTPVPTVRNMPAATLTQEPATPAVPSSGKTSTRQGVFRVGNPTGYPVRVALLSRKKSVEAARANETVAQRMKAGDQSLYELPAHWDFAPEEGGTQGLLVSLPDRALKLKKGDVLIAFAQDGSGRYWGPYVVDETALPRWDAKTVEWQLILQP